MLRQVGAARSGNPGKDNHHDSEWTSTFSLLPWSLFITSAAPALLEDVFQRLRAMDAEIEELSRYLVDKLKS